MNPESSTSRYRIRWDRLAGGILVLGIAFVFTALGAFLGTKFAHSQGQHLVVERLDIVEEDGSLAISLANSTRVPSATIDGKVLMSDQSDERAIPQITLFDGRGDEVGGLRFGVEVNEDGYHAMRSLTLDGYKHDETVALFVQQTPEGAVSGLGINDRPTDLTLIDAMTNLGLEPGATREDFFLAFAAMPESQRASTERDLFGVRRISLESNLDNDAILVLNDGQGRPRIRLVAPESGQAQIQILDEDLEVVASIPPQIKADTE